MDIAADRRRFLIAGAAAVATVAAGSAYLWWDALNATHRPPNDAVTVVPGTDRPPIVAPSSAVLQPVVSEASAAPDRDTEARLNRLMEDDAANSRLRMRERQERRSDASQSVPASPGDATPSTWAP